MAIGAFAGIVYRYSLEDTQLIWIDKTPGILSIVYKLLIALALSLPAGVIFFIATIFSDKIVVMVFQIALPVFVEFFLLFCGFQQSLYRKIGTVVLSDEKGALSVNEQNGPRIEMRRDSNSLV